jgi:hypothetical protein
MRTGTGSDLKRLSLGAALVGGEEFAFSKYGCSARVTLGGCLDANGGFFAQGGDGAG